MTFEWSNCTVSPSTASYEGDKAFVLLAMTTATLSFLLNLSQFVVILHQRLLTLNKNFIIINLCVCGQLSSATVLFHVRKILRFWQEEEVEADNYLLCFLLPSGLHLLTLFTFTPLITLLVLQHHLVAVRRHSSDHFIIGLMVVLAWCEAIIISLIPLTGWNDWKGMCSLPEAWSPSFTVLICVIYFLHYPMVIILLTDLCTRATKRRCSVSPLCGHSSSPQVLEMEVHAPEDSFRPRSVFVLVFLWAAGTLPFVLYTIGVAMSDDSDPCASLVANEKAAMWTSWVTVVFAAVRPLFHVLMEEDLGGGTVAFITTVFRIKK